MNRVRVQSSNIASVGHDPRTSTLEVEFHGGRVYQYDDVNYGEFNRLLNAASIGSHYARYIKGVKPRKRFTGTERN